MMNDFFAYLIGFRKLIVIMVFMAVMVSFRVLNYINGEEFANNLQLAVVAYIGANLGEHFVDTAKQWIEAKFDTLRNERNEKKSDDKES